MAGNILWIVPKWPLPPLDGARVATCGLLKSLTASGKSIDLLAVIDESEEVDLTQVSFELGVRNVFIVKRKAAGKKLLKRLVFLLRDFRCPITVQPYAAPHISGSIAEILSGHFDQLDSLNFHLSKNPSEVIDWDILVYDGLHCAGHSMLQGSYQRPDSVEAKIIYRAHNRESDIWTTKAAKSANPLIRAVFSWQAAAMRRFEDSLLKNCDAVAAVSVQELEVFKEINPQAAVAAVPIGCEFSGFEALEEKNVHNLMFIGRLDWPPNREGLEWFLRRVWPQVSAARSDLNLIVAGSGDGSWLRQYQGLANVEIVGYIDRVKEVYKKSLLSVVPVFYGGGTRVKVIEACRYGRACLSTELGVAGTGLIAGKSYIRAESEQDWIEQLLGLDWAAAAAVGENAYNSARELFSVEESAQRFVNLIDATE